MVVAAKNENVQKPQSLKKKSTTKNNNNSSTSNTSNTNNSLSPTRPPIKPAESHQKTSTSLGSKIHAQRKFAQGASITIGHSPVKHAKISIKKRVEKKALPLSPTFIPAKRPKTEDFLTFLCYRGTPVLPAGLDVFNCPAETEAAAARGPDDKNAEGVKKLVETPEKNVVSTSLAVEPTPRASASSNHASGSTSSSNYHASSSNGKSKDKSSNNTPAKSSTNSQTAEASSNRKSPGLKRIPDVMVVVKQAEKAIAAFGKVRKDLTTALLKPNRINERDARFAMTALKLKYQEKRLAKSKTASSIAVASKITKKGRNVILTRSKAHTLPTRGDKPKVTVKKKKELITQKLRKESPSQSRNAPSPDIIYGVSSHSKNAAKKTSPSKSSSKSNSASSDSSSNSSNSSSESSNNDSDESSSESSEEEEEKEEAAAAPAVGRSLRSGKEVVSQQPKKPASNNNNSKPAKISKPSRVSTRSARRISTSPLRELPMYGVQKRKPNKSDSKKNSNDKQKNDSGQASHRPTRKTKETASICLGLINNFSSDEENSTDKPADDNDSSGTSSSSEAEYLEKQYNASLKREEENNKNAKSKKAAPPAKNNSNNKQKQKEVAKSKGKTQNPPKKGSTTTTTTGKNRPAKRILRSQSTRETISKQKKGEPGRVATRRFSVPVTNDRTPEGAARKSASVYPRWKGSYRSSSDSSDESDTTEDDDDDDNAGEGEDEESSEEKSSVESTTSYASKKRASLVRTTSNSKPTGLAARKSATSTPVKAPPITKPPPRKRPSVDTKAAKRMKSRSISRESDSEEDEEDEEKSEKSEVKKVIIEILRDEEPSEKSSSESSSEEEEEESEETSSDEEAKPVVQKTSIAIQVDMDSEENVDMNQMYASPPESISGTPPMNSSSSSGGTYTDMPSFMPSINLTPHPSLPFVPFSAGAPGPSFYPTLHLNPPVVSNIHVLAARGTQEFSLTHPGITMNIPATLSMQSYGAAMGPPLLQPNTMCFSSTSISAATLQTHIRSVAANLDIPLVRPIIGSDPLNIPFPRAPMGPMGAGPPGLSMTRPMPMWQGDPTRPHSSAFRVPMNTNAGGGVTNDKQGLARVPMSNNNLLPLSVVHPQGQQSRVTNTSQHHHQHSATGVNAVRRTLTGASPNTPGYSILQNLPNVSIVPRFDRNSKPVVCPPDQEALEKKLKQEKTAEAASSSNNNNNNSSSSSSNSKTKDKREKGSRKKKGMIIPHPSSPLTVRKDSANPVTYCGTSKKVAKSCSTSMDEKPTVTVKESSSDPFIKLLQLKKAGSDGKVSKNAVSKSSGGSQSQPATTSTSLKEPKKLENCNSSSLPVQEDIKGSNKSTENNSHKVPLSCSNGGERTMEAPTYCPTEEQFQDPLKYIEKIRPEAEKYGIARIIPPRSFRPDCNVDDDMRFTAYNHYIHKMFQRWGPNVHETMAIKEHLRNTDVDTSSVPVIGGMEVDLCTLYHTVQSFGGLKETIEKQKWTKVSDAMHIPKAANDRVSKLDSIYVKYVLPYETLSESERKRLLSKVERNWNARQEKLSRRADQSESESSDEDPLEEVDDCIIKGKSTPLTSYYRVARNTKTMLFPSKEPSSSEVEEEYWKMVRKRTRHLCVYSGSIDCAGVGWGFPLPKPSNKHPWNLKVLANSPGSVLRNMGPVMGATVPTLHVGMIFTTYCWYRDPHGLPWIEYLHSGGNKIWYVIPAAAENKFRQVLKEVMPLQCKNKKIWLASDSAMIPPEILQEKGVPLYRTVQNPGEFLVVFPKAFTSAICTGYVVSESVCYAPVEWLDSAPQTFNDIKSSKEPPVFALEQLLLSIVQDHHKVSLDVLERVYGPMERILKEEFAMRKRLSEMGVKSGKLCKNSNSEKVSKKKRKQEDEAPQCDNCNYILHLSLVNNETREFTYCLKHAVEYLQKHKSHVKSSVIRYDYTQEELTASMTEVSNRLSNS